MSSGFVTETEIAESRKKRQEEWEKVRKPDQPIERPDEPYDSRSLFDRLQEQKIKKDIEFEEAHKLKNLIRGLEDDEVQFLDLVDQNKIEAEKRQQIEEAKELREFRERVATLHEQSIENKIHSDITKPKPKSMSNRPSQKSLLGGALRKRQSDGGTTNTDIIQNKISKNIDDKIMKPQNITSPIKNSSYVKGALQCVAVLPGIGRYQESSDSEISTDSEEEALQSEKFDLVGRKKLKGCEKSE